MTLPARPVPHLDDDMRRELCYCREMCGWRFATGQIADAQTAMLDRGWLEPSPIKPGFVGITPLGRRVLAAWETGT